MKAAALLSAIFFASSQAVSAAEIFGTHILVSHAALKGNLRDYTVGIAHEIAPSLRLRYEYGYAGYERKGDWRDFQRDELDRRQRRDIHFRLQSFSVGADYAFSSGWRTAASLLYAKAPGSIHIEGEEAGDYGFSATSLCTQFALGYRWEVGSSLRVGFDVFVTPVYIIRSMDVDDAAKTTTGEYSPRHEIAAALNSVQDFRTLKAAVGFEF